MVWACVAAMHGDNTARTMRVRIIRILVLATTTLLIASLSQRIAAETAGDCYAPPNVEAVKPGLLLSDLSSPLFTEKFGSLTRALRINRTLCSEVVDVIGAKRFHLQTYAGFRAPIVRALAAAEGEEELIFGLLMESITVPLNRADPYGRDVLVRNNIAEISPEAANVLVPGGNYSPLESYVLVDAAALAASRLDRVYVDQFVELLRPRLHEQFLAGRTSNNDGVILLISKSSLAELVVFDMLQWAENSPLVATLMGGLLATWETPSASVQEVVRAHCDGPESSTLLAPPVCEVIAWKWGDPAAIERLADMLSDEEYGAVSGRYLLNEIGSAGVAVLRRELLSDDLIAARNAAIVCNLGREAGEDAIARMKELVEMLPDDRRIGNLSNRCESDGSGFRVSLIGTDLEEIE